MTNSVTLGYPFYNVVLEGAENVGFRYDGEGGGGGKGVDGDQQSGEVWFNGIWWVSAEGCEVQVEEGRIEGFKGQGKREGRMRFDVHRYI